MTMTQMQLQSSTTWESLIPTSFKNTLYLPSLKISVTAGSFVQFSTGEAARNDVGRIVDVVTSLDLVDVHESHALNNLAIPENVENQIPVQFAKVNIFKDRHLLCDSNFPAGHDSRFHTGWQRIVQLDQCEWIPSYSISGLVFVALEDDTLFLDDCQGMSNFFVAKYRMAGNGDVCIIPRHACPPFPGRIEGFRKIWSVDSCEIIFNSILQIKQEMQRILCRAAQSQGDFAVKKAKLHLPSCSWFFIKNSMERQGVDSISGIQYSQPRSVLSWGLSYHSQPYTGYRDVLRFDTVKKMHAFRALFGTMTGYGVRKNRPKYSDGRSHLCLNDVLNVVVCRQSSEDNVGDTSSNDTLSDGSSLSHRFQRFSHGVTDDGIDLAYDSSEGLLQIVLRYRKVVVTNESLQTLVGVSVSKPESTSLRNQEEPQTAVNILAGMEFIDGMHVMQVQKVDSSEIRAKKLYRIDGGTTTKATASEVITYNNIADVYRRIQQMLEKSVQ